MSMGMIFHLPVHIALGVKRGARPTPSRYHMIWYNIDVYAIFFVGAPVYVHVVGASCSCSLYSEVEENL